VLFDSSFTRHAMAQMVEELGFKPVGRGFNSPWGR